MPASVPPNPPGVVRRAVTASQAERGDAGGEGIRVNARPGDPPTPSLPAALARVEEFLRRYNRLAGDAARATRTVLRGKPAEVIDAAVRKALRETLFRFDLVMRINVVAHEMIDRELLLYAVFAGQLGLLVSDDRKERLLDPAYLRRMAQCRELTAQRVDELLAAQEARSMAEQRYLDRRPVLFPDAVTAWAERLRLDQELAVMADRLAELDGVSPAAPQDPDAVTARTAVLVADLIEPARSTALDKLDEGRQALAIATEWLRSKREVTGSLAEVSDVPTPTL